MDSSVCECGRRFTQRESLGVWCYPCKLSGLSFAWRGGGGHTKEDFHNTTNKEVADGIVREAKQNGYDVAPVPKIYTGP